MKLAVEVGRKVVASTTTEPQDSPVTALDIDLGHTPWYTLQDKVVQWTLGFFRLSPLDRSSADLVWLTVYFPFGGVSLRG